MSGLAGTPYVGLRPFEREDAELFFGRQEQTRQLSARLRSRRFLVVIGRSGSGKSSLVKAGLLPGLAAESDASGRPLWQTETFRPAGRPIHNLAAALGRLSDRLTGRGSGAPAQRSDIRTRRYEAALRRSSKGLVELAAELPLGGRTRVLLVIDQFEEVFRYRGYGDDRAAGASSATEDEPEEGPDGEPVAADLTPEELPAEAAYDEAAAFVKLLLRASRTPGCRLHVLLTMRLDYLADCSRFRDLPEAINDSQFLVPRLTRHQRREAVERPALENGWTLEPVLIQRLLNESGDDPDQLPVLQHALMRSAVEAGAGKAMKLPHYQEVGGVAGALSGHAEAIYEGLATDADRKIAEGLFKSLTDVDREGRLRRRPLMLRDLIGELGAEKADVERVIEAFRVEEASFLMPPIAEKLRPDSRVDISHEALIRKWSRLSGTGRGDGWVEEEVLDGRIYRSLVEASEAFAQDPKNVLSPSITAARLLWWDERGPNGKWAERHGGAFSQVQALLAASEAKRQEGLEREARFRRLQRLAWSVGAVVAGVLIVLLVSLIVTGRRAGQAEARAAEQERLRQEAELAREVVEEEAQAHEAEIADLERLLSELGIELQRREKTQERAVQTVVSTSSAADVVADLADNPDPHALPILARSLGELTEELTESQTVDALGGLLGVVRRAEDEGALEAAGQALVVLERVLPATLSSETLAALVDPFGGAEARRAFFKIGEILGREEAGEVGEKLGPLLDGLATRAGLPAPRLFLHISSEAQRAVARELERQLETFDVLGTGLSVPGIELVDYKASSALRCFRPEECLADGKEILSILNRQPEIPTVRFQDLSETYRDRLENVRPRHYELWLGLEAFAAAYVSVSDLVALGASQEDAERYFEELNAAMTRTGVTTTQRQAQFLAHLFYESGRLRFEEENLNYSAKALRAVFGTWFPTEAEAEKYARKPEEIANRVYANRMGNRDEASGDGWRFRGRGFGQLSGRSNYQKFAAWVGDEAVVDEPEIVATEYAVLTWAFIWDANKLNAIADTGDVERVTKKLVGGTLGLAQRQELYDRASALLAQE